MIWLYRILYIPFFLISFPYYLSRMLKRGGYGKDFHHRLGFVEQLPEKKLGIRRIWIHAVSLGEVNALKPLIEKLMATNQVEIIITTTTSTAYHRAIQLYQGVVAKVAAFPFDFWLSSRNTWKRIEPDIVVLMEGELWPEHIYQATKRKVPVFLINARLSNRSYKRYLKVKFLAKHLVLKYISLLLAGSNQDLERFIALGMDPKKAICTGNMKFDVKPSIILSDEEKLKLKVEMGFLSEKDKGQATPLILMGSSTWPGEEILLIDIFEKAIQEGIDCRLLIVPRHAERREEIKDLLAHQSRTWHLRSICKNAPTGTYIYICDTVGELSMISQIADLALIGKSIAPNDGGQTPIEAASIGLPIVYGPNMSNFKQVCQSLERETGMGACRDAQEVKEKIIQLLSNKEQRVKLGSALKNWYGHNQGATEKTVNAIIEYITNTKNNVPK